jgi:hypothetical protein
MANVVRLAPWQVQEIRKCASDPWYCLQNYVWLKREADLNATIVPFSPFEKQKRILTNMLNGVNTVVNKSRRVGFSWIVAFFVWWLLNFKKGVKVLLLSRTEQDAFEILEKVKFIHNNLAWRGDTDNHELAEKAPWLTGEIVTSNKSEFARGFRNAKGQIHAKSVVLSLTNTDNSGRGQGATVAIMDEFAFYDNNEMTWRSMSKTIIGGGFYVIGSTPAMIGDKFHWLVANAEAGHNRVKGRLLYDYLTFHHSESWIPPDDVEADKAQSTDQDANQEWELTFLSPGNTVFSPEKLARCFVDIHDEFYPDKDRQREIIAHLERFQSMVNRMDGNRKYISGADTIIGKISRKSSEKDWNAWTAFTDDGVQAYLYTSQETLAQWAGYLNEDVRGREYWINGTLSKKHAQFPGLLMIEEEGPGQTAIQNHRTPPDGFSEMSPWRTGGNGKLNAVLWLKSLIENEQIIITQRSTYNQMMMFLDNGPGKNRFSAPDGFNDDEVDTVLAAAAGMQLHGTRIMEWGVDRTPLRPSQTGDFSPPPSEKVPYGPQVVQYEGLPAGAGRMVDLLDDLGQIEVPYEVPYLDDDIKRYIQEISRGDLDITRRQS